MEDEIGIGQNIIHNMGVIFKKCVKHIEIVVIGWSPKLLETLHNFAEGSSFLQFSQFEDLVKR